MRHPISLLTTTLVFCCSIIACTKTNHQDFPVNNPAIAQIDQLLADSVPTIFGGKCYAIIEVDGKPVYEKSIGGYNTNTRQLIASCSKWLSGAVLMSLVDEGKLKLTDTLGKYLPIFSVYGKGNITIAQLFSHTSGFPGNSPQGYENDNLLTLAQAVDLLAKNTALVSTPGTAFYYGGVGMHIAGRVCEVVSGKKWEQLANDKIFNPCGMTRTDYGNGSNPIIAGGARSTPTDYMLFLNMLMRQGVAVNGKRVLSENAVQLMEQNYTGNTIIAYSPYPATLLAGNNIYGIGNWRDVTTAGDILVENSSPGAFGSHPWINRSKKMAGFIFTFVPAEGATKTFPTCLKIRAAARLF